MLEIRERNRKAQQIFGHSDIINTTVSFRALDLYSQCHMTWNVHMKYKYDVMRETLDRIRKEKTKSGEGRKRLDF